MLCINCTHSKTDKAIECADKECETLEQIMQSALEIIYEYDKQMKILEQKPQSQ